MVTIKTKEITDIYGIEKILYKDGRKTLAEISRPNAYNNMKYRTFIHVTKYGGVGGDFDSLEDAQDAMRRYFTGFYFGNVVIN